MAENREEILSADVELHVPVSKVLEFLQLDEQGRKKVMQYTESYGEDVLISKSKYMLIRDQVLKAHGSEEASPVMLYEDYLARYSSKYKVLDVRIGLLQDFVDKNLTFLTGIREEPFTHKLWVTPKFYEMFREYLKYVEDGTQTPYEVVASRFGLKEVDIYTLSAEMGIMYGNADGVRSMTPLQYATIVAFLTNYRLVVDKKMLAKLKNSKLPFYKYRNVGIFVEESLFKYLGDEGRDEVVREKVEVVVDGKVYYDEVDALGYLLDDAKLPRMSVLNAIHRGLLCGSKIDGKVLYSLEELEALVGYHTKGYNLSLAIIFARGIVGEEEFKEKYLNKYQLRKLLVELRDMGYISNAFMNHYTNKPVESATELYGVPVYDKEMVIRDLGLHRVLSPIGSAYKEGYYNVLLVLQYLTANKINGSEEWSMLGFRKEDGEWLYDNDVTSLGVMATPNIRVISKDYLNNEAVAAIEKYIKGQEREVREVVEKILERVTLLD